MDSALWTYIDIHYLVEALEYDSIRGVSFDTRAASVDELIHQSEAGNVVVVWAFGIDVDTINLVLEKLEIEEYVDHVLQKPDLRY